MFLFVLVFNFQVLLELGFDDSCFVKIVQISGCLFKFSRFVQFILLSRCVFSISSVSSLPFLNFVSGWRRPGLIWREAFRPSQYHLRLRLKRKLYGIQKP
ncbi:hypothetical protein CUMW_097790 [Citrus unshiu]|uniref:Uncharacterized protein n=2 Tax=Citrus TaxID=2706 RepID=A0A067E9F1_CITSI|nr:hypothetical protein CISIN_1g034295mg [Citrus sinensis]GAY46533.1 hypothetical protein CUMW_097790 [Citrus unshiu]